MHFFCKEIPDLKSKYIKNIYYDFLFEKILNNEEMLKSVFCIKSVITYNNNPVIDIDFYNIDNVNINIGITLFGNSSICISSAEFYISKNSEIFFEESNKQYSILLFANEKNLYKQSTAGNWIKINNNIDSYWDSFPNALKKVLSFNLDLLK